MAKTKNTGSVTLDMTSGTDCTNPRPVKVTMEFVLIPRNIEGKQTSKHLSELANNIDSMIDKEDYAVAPGGKIHVELIKG
jgi:hypothetical protein